MACIYGSDQCKICDPQPVADVAQWQHMPAQPQTINDRLREELLRLQAEWLAKQRIACVPDDQPQQETYGAKRQRIAAERNPQPPEQWFWFDVPTPETRTDGIRRAVDRMTRSSAGCRYGYVGGE